MNGDLVQHQRLRKGNHSSPNRGTLHFADALLLLPYLPLLRLLAALGDELVHLVLVFLRCRDDCIVRGDKIEIRAQIVAHALIDGALSHA